MIRSKNTAAESAQPLVGARARAWGLWLPFLGRPRLISNLLALVALFSIGFV